MLEVDNNLTLLLSNELEKPTNILQLLNAIKTQIIIQTNHLYMVKETLEAGKNLIVEIDKDLGLTTDMVNNYD